MQISKIDTEILLEDKTKRQKKNLWKLIKKQKFLIFMSLPFVVWIIIF